MDIVREIGVALRTGKIIIGSKEVIKNCIQGKLKMIILADNCPEEIKEETKYYSKLSQTPVYIFPGNSWDLGAACRKPFMVSAIGIIDPGESNLLSLVIKEEE